MTERSNLILSMACAGILMLTACGDSPKKLVVAKGPSSPFEASTEPSSAPKSESPSATTTSSPISPKPRKSSASPSSPEASPGSIEGLIYDAESGERIVIDIYYFVSQSTEVPGEYWTAGGGIIKAGGLPPGKFRLCFPDSSASASLTFNGGYGAECYKDKLYWEDADWITVPPGAAAIIEVRLTRGTRCPTPQNKRPQPSYTVGGCSP